MRFFVVALFIFFLIARPALANQKVAVYFGGGGDPLKDEDGKNKTQTIFYENIEGIKNVSDRGWDFSGFYHDGSHKDDNTLAQKTWKEKAKPFNKENFSSEITKLEQRLENMNHKDQLLVVVNSHGSSLATPGEKSHLVATEDEDVSLSELSRLKAKAKSKGVKLAIVDLSCHSGPTLQLADADTCVVTSAGTGNGYRGFSGTFVKNLASAKNLESAFLNARPNLKLGQPQISGAPGTVLSQMTDEYKRAFFGKSDYAYPGYCIPAPSLPSFFDQLGETRDAVIEALKETPEWKTFSDAVTGYQKKLKEVESQRLSLSTTYQRWQELLNDFYCAPVSGNCIILLSLDKEIARLEKSAADSSLSAEGRGKDLKDLEYFKNLKKDPIVASKQARLKIAEKYLMDNERWEKYYGDMDAERDKVVTAERNLYTKMYRHPQVYNDKPNPCRDFTL